MSAGWSRSYIRFNVYLALLASLVSSALLVYCGIVKYYKDIRGVQIHSIKVLRILPAYTGQYWAPSELPRGTREKYFMFPDGQSQNVKFSKILEVK